MNKSNLSKDCVFLRQAKADDIGALEQLLNCCYRETAGWTNEARFGRRYSYHAR